jgi:hypothetical protein
MAQPLRTNPAYAALAYRKTIIAFTKVHLRRKFLGDEVSGPREVLVCEEVFPIDSKIPPEAVQEYIETLSREESEIDVQLRKFELTPSTSKGTHGQQTRSQEPGLKNAQGRQRHRQGRRPN